MLKLAVWETCIWKKNKEIMSQYFEYHISLLIKGFGLRFLRKREVDKNFDDNEWSTTVNQILIKLHSNSYFVDLSLQNISLKNHNMNLLITDLRKIIC